MKTNNEMLKEICDVIRYDLIKNGFDIDTNTLMGGCIIKILNQFQRIGDRDEREIIFTQNFMDKIYHYGVKNKGEGVFISNDSIARFNEMLLGNLDNPTLYLYNTLGLGKQ